ncbi:MAG: hypothetical protein CO034_01105 [Parcubacteria group bacterium CG_4_9_14_0_2_um_filter_35_11]|nr:MAG: hypothetical protein CO034_01105 [Parcubacteria group bacterium CG_4_9_14_0_2_um_filter_35_11]
MFGFFNFLIWPILIIGVIFFFVRFLRRRRKAEVIKEKDWYLQFSLSKEDTVSQFFFLFSVFFLGVTILAFNKDLGDPLSLRTILLLVSVIGLGIGYYFKVIYTLAVSLIGLVGWWGAQAAEWAQGKDIKGAALFVGLLFISILFYLLSRVHEKKVKFKRVSIVYLILGLIPVTATLFLFSTKSGLRTLGEITKGASFFASWEITFSLFVFLVSIVGILVYALSKNLIFKPEALVIGFLVVLFSIIAFLPEQTMFLQQRMQQWRYEYYRDINLSGSGILWAIIFNILVLIEAFGLVLLSYFKKEGWLNKIGLLFVGALFIVKFFEWQNHWGSNPLLISMAVVMFLTCGLTVYLLVKSLRKKFNLKIEDKIYSVLGLVPLTFFLFLLSSESGLKNFNFNVQSLPFFSYLLILTTIYLLLNLILWFYFFRTKINLFREITFLIAFLFLLTLIILVFPHKNLFTESNELSGLGIFWAVVFNLMLFSEIVGIIFLGYFNNKNFFINLGIVFMSILIFVKYFDWFFAFLDKSIFFIGAGILLFVVGWFMEKGRRYMLSAIKKEEISQNQ